TAAVLCDVALVHGHPTDHGRRLEGICRARGARSGTCLRHIAGAGRRPTGRARVTGRVLTDGAGPIALVERAGIPVVRTRAPGGLEFAGRGAAVAGRPVVRAVVALLTDLHDAVAADGGDGGRGSGGGCGCRRGIVVAHEPHVLDRHRAAPRGLDEPHLGGVHVAVGGRRPAAVGEILIRG